MDDYKPSGALIAYWKRYKERYHPLEPINSMARSPATMKHLFDDFASFLERSVDSRRMKNPPHFYAAAMLRQELERFHPRAPDKIREWENAVPQLKKKGQRPHK